RDRRPMNLGESDLVQAIARAWAAGDEIRGWARLWDMVYGHLARLLAADAQVRAAALIVRFEALCDEPAETIRAVLRHGALADEDRIAERFAPLIDRPDYYKATFTPEELAVIRDETAQTARQWGY